MLLLYKTVKYDLWFVCVFCCLCCSYLVPMLFRSSSEVHRDMQEVAFVACTLTTIYNGPNKIPAAVVVGTVSTV